MGLNPPRERRTPPYWRLSGFYFFYFATVGALIPYWGLYLQSLGFGAQQIGNLIALLFAARIVAPYVWGWMADHHYHRMTVARVSALLTVIAFSGVFLGNGFWWLAVVMLVFSFFWNASLPLLEAATMSHVGASGQYGLVRLWGSIGFIVTVSLLGPLLDIQGTSWLLPAVVALLAGSWLFSLAIPDSETATRAPHPVPLLKVILRPDVLMFLIACFLMSASHGPYYTFYTIYLHDHGYSKGLIGALWAFAVVCEIGVFVAMSRLLVRIDEWRILLVSLALAALRWILIGGFPESLAVLVVAQALHAASFGAFHAGAVQIVHRLFTGSHQHRGQAIYSSVSFGAGGVLGSFYSGYAWTTWGSAWTYGVAAFLAALAFAGVLAVRPRI